MVCSKFSVQNKATSSLQSFELIQHKGQSSLYEYFQLYPISDSQVSIFRYIP